MDHFAVDELQTFEFGWSMRGITMEDCTAQSEYFMMRSDHLAFRDVRLKGKSTMISPAPGT